MANLYSSVDDFKQSVDKGFQIVVGEQAPIDKQDHEVMKSLLAVFITAIMDPESFKDGFCDEKLTSQVKVNIDLSKAALLAANHLGKKSASPKTVKDFLDNL